MRNQPPFRILRAAVLLRPQVAVLPHCCRHYLFIGDELSQLTLTLLDHLLYADLIGRGDDVGRRPEDMAGILGELFGRGDGGEIEVKVIGDAGAVGREVGDGFGVFGGEGEVACL